MGSKITKRDAELIVKAAILEVEKMKLMSKVDPNKYCDNCKFCPCACHLIPTK